jgi:hypothetical protein
LIPNLAIESLRRAILGLLPPGILGTDGPLFRAGRFHFHEFSGVAIYAISRRGQRKTPSNTSISKYFQQLSFAQTGQNVRFAAKERQKAHFSGHWRPIPGHLRTGWDEKLSGFAALS